MANIFLTETAQFRPFSYQEMLAPVKDYMEAYNKYEEDFANLDLMAADVASKLSHPDDAVYAKQVLDFQKELQSAMNDFYEKDITLQTRKTLRGLQSTYTNKLNKINEAYKLKVADQQKLTDLQRANPKLVIEGIGESINDYMDGNIPHGTFVNTKDTFDEAKKEAEGTSSRFLDMLMNPKSVLGGQYYRYLTKQGISQEGIDDLNAFLNDPKNLKTEAGKALFNIVERQRQSSGYYNLKDKINRDRVDASILNGIFAGATYKENIQYMQDRSYISPKDNSGNGTDTPELPAQQIWGRTVQRVEVDKGVKTTKIAKDLAFIQSMIDNPNDILKTEVVKVNTNPSLGSAYKTESVEMQPNLEKLEQLSKKYGFKFNIIEKDGNAVFDDGSSLDELKTIIEEAAQLHQDYILNVTDQSKVVKDLKETVIGYQNGSNKLGLLEVVDGRVIAEKDKNKESKKKKEWLDSDSTKIIMYKPGIGTVITDGNVTYKLDMSALYPELASKEKLIESLIVTERKKGESVKDYNERRRQEIALATILINGVTDTSGMTRAGYMEDLYRTFNTQVPVQGKTTSKPV